MIAVVLPTLDTPDALHRVLAELPAGMLAIVVDDGSREPIHSIRRDTCIVRHEENRGYGGAQKSGYAAALAAGASRIVLLHGDGQYDTPATLALAEELGGVEAALGSRFLADPSVIPSWRRFGNRALTGLANLRFGGAFTDLHSGARAFRAETLRSLPLDSFSDDFLFDQQVLVALIRRGASLVERPVGTRYDTTTRSISFRRSMQYGVGCVRVILG
ncbi:glycosyl transferase family 2 [Deltaproteobacteria bacterium]|nr:glycosyl transferase family 2 [Deltaproteobacteria bacterium]